MARKIKLKVLREEGGVAVFDGTEFFKFMDSKGLPLELMLQRCVFDWLTFIEAAKRSGNYSFEKLWRDVKEAWWFLGVDATQKTEGQMSSFAEKFEFLWFRYVRPDDPGKAKEGV